MCSLELIIGNKNYSTWSLRPWFFLKNLDIEFKEKRVFLFEDDTHDILKPYFSNEKVPVLLDADLQIWDTLAIIEYVADKYPEKSGWPMDVKTRAIARSAAAEMHSSFMALRNALPMNIKKHFPGYPINDDVKADIQRIFDVWEYCKQNATEDGPWLMGEFSGVDAMYAPVVMRLVGYDVKLSDFAAEYADNVLNNIHMQEWMKEGKQETQIISFDEV